jgi:hypothetical protein
MVGRVLELFSHPACGKRKYPNADMGKTCKRQPGDTGANAPIQLVENALGPTIRAKGPPVFHYRHDRPLNVPEVRALQSFPNRYEQVGSMTEQYQQVGNAVPACLARAVAESFRQILLFVYREELAEEEVEPEVEEGGDEPQVAGALNISEVTDNGEQVEEPNVVGDLTQEDSVSPMEIDPVSPVVDPLLPSPVGVLSTQEVADKGEQVEEHNTEDGLTHADSVPPMAVDPLLPPVVDPSLPSPVDPVPTVTYGSLLFPKIAKIAKIWRDRDSKVLYVVILIYWIAKTKDDKRNTSEPPQQQER